jgi:hypothetical protein
MGFLDKLRKKAFDKAFEGDGLSYLGRQKGYQFFDGTCDACGARFQWMDNIISYPIPLSASRDKPPRSMLDIGGWCMKCDRMLCPAECEFIPANMKGDDWWIPGCRDCQSMMAGSRFRTQSKARRGGG